MLDQTFSAVNFRRIYDHENRKGTDLENKFFPTLKYYTEKTKQINEDIKLLNKACEFFAKEDYASEHTKLKDDKNKVKDQKNAAIKELLESLADNIRSSKFTINLTAMPGPKGKTVYIIDKSAESYFAVKQLQRNVNRLYGVIQSDRYQIIGQVQETLSTKFPCQIVKTDISSFYESIDRSKLVRKLDDDQLLSLSSKRLIRRMLEQYGVLSGANTGIPRGVGLSAYLGELYLRNMDRQIRDLPGLILYCRYVDDILAVFAPPPHGGPQSYVAEIGAAMQSIGLSMNVTKTRTIELPNSIAKFEYLGYRFCFKNNKLCISPSASKLLKYKFRIRRTFEEYRKTASINQRKAARDLIGRLRFITGNTRLLNNKNHAVTGIYYNNSFVTNLDSLRHLDNFARRAAKGTLNPYVEQAAAKFSFVTGFSERRFHNFRAAELQNIVRVWKHAE